MENFIFAGNAVAPTFVVIALGFWLKTRGILTEEFVSKGNVLCFHVLFPILVFFNIYDAETIDFTYLKPIIFTLGVIAASVSVLALLVPQFVRERKQQAVLYSPFTVGITWYMVCLFPEALAESHALRWLLQSWRQPYLC